MFAMRTRSSTVLGSLDVGSRVVGRGGRRKQVPAEKEKGGGENQVQYLARLIRKVTSST
jgi:hypothetical protein